VEWHPFHHYEFFAGGVSAAAFSLHGVRHYQQELAILSTQRAISVGLIFRNLLRAKASAKMVLEAPEYINKGEWS
jgi:hypothetical protein